MRDEDRPAVVAEVGRCTAADFIQWCFYFGVDVRGGIREIVLHERHAGDIPVVNVHDVGIDNDVSLGDVGGPVLDGPDAVEADLGEGFFGDDGADGAFRAFGGQMDADGQRAADEKETDDEDSGGDEDLGEGETFAVFRAQGTRRSIMGGTPMPRGVDMSRFCSFSRSPVRQCGLM